MRIAPLCNVFDLSEVVIEQMHKKILKLSVKLLNEKRVTLTRKMYKAVHFHHRFTYGKFMVSFLTHLFPIHPFSTPENIRRPYGFRMFSGSKE